MKLKTFSDALKTLLRENIVLKRMQVKANLFVQDTFSQV